MKRATLVIASMLLMSAAALAQTYYNANLNGKYSVQYGFVETGTWVLRSLSRTTNPLFWRNLIHRAMNRLSSLTCPAQADRLRAV